MELYVFSPAFGLASYDPHSLASLIYVNYLETECSFIDCSSPSSSPTGVLPSLKDDTVHVSGFFEIVKYLQKKGLKLKGTLDSFEEASALSVSLYLDSKCTDVLSFFRYVDEDNYLGSTRPELAKVLPFLERYYLPNRFRESSFALLEKYKQCIEVENEKRKKSQYSKLAFTYLQKTKSDKGLDPLEANIMKIGRKLLEDISKLVNENTFIYGEKVHYLDILICSQLAHIFLVKTPNQKLADYALSSFPNLFSYVDRVLALGNTEKLQSSRKSAPSIWGTIPTLWPSTKVLLLTKEQSARPAPTPEEIALRKSRAYSLIAATFTMAFYVIYHGLLTSGEEAKESQEYYDINSEIANEIDD